MGTAKIGIDVKAFVGIGTAYPQYVRTAGSTTLLPVEGLAFDAAADEACGVRLTAFDYASGNLTLRIHWYADTASSGVVRWGGSIAALTPNTDSQDVETDTWATETTTDTTHLGSTGQREHTTDVTISNLDSLAADDSLWLRLRRIGSNGADTMSGDAIVTGVDLLYTT